MLRKNGNHLVKSAAIASAGLLSLVASMAIAGQAVAVPTEGYPEGSAEQTELENGIAPLEEPTDIPQNLPQSVEDSEEPLEVLKSRAVDQTSTDNTASAPASPCEIPQANFTGTIPSSVYRISGATRYETSAKVAQTVAAVPTGASSAVFIASGTNFSDGLSLGALAGHAGWPLLLTAPGSLSPETRRVIEETAPTHVYIAGGTAAVSQSVESAAVAATGRSAEEVTVVRFAGGSRYETSAAIAECFEPGSPVFLTTGADFADGVVAGAPAVKSGGPVILTQRNVLGTEAEQAITRLKPTSVSIIGGTWPAAQLTKIKAASSTDAVTVYAGANRYATSAKVANAFYGTGSKPLTFTVGTSFPDALAGVSAATVVESPIVLTRSDCRPKDIEAVSKQATNKVILGGTAAVSDAAHTSTCQPPKPTVPTKTLLSVAQKQVGKSYVLGATGPNSFDCSGLTQYVYREMGVNIPRNSYQQLSQGRRVSNPAPGDIVVLGGGSHVGIYVSPGVMIDAGNPRVGVSQRAIYATPSAYIRF
ncbi:cell wall-binding repeat-containing protein [Actinomyces minihominis]|uniref:cell wall-binding repeat-containing protein n=1 Tax=Actinomyces minihominis TaxID=2002838 RepID=UPI000C06F98F|nr:cell wall-binding repeat-containing protein [Actinomyces minihominis]